MSNWALFNLPHYCQCLATAIAISAGSIARNISARYSMYRTHEALKPCWSLQILQDRQISLVDRSIQESMLNEVHFNIRHIPILGNPLIYHYFVQPKAAHLDSMAAVLFYYL